MNELYELYQQTVLKPFFSAFAHFARFIGFDPGADYYNWFVAITLIQVATFVLFIMLVRIGVNEITSLLGCNVGKNYEEYQNAILSHENHNSSVDYCVYTEENTKLQDILKKLKPFLILAFVVFAAMLLQLVAHETMSPWLIDYDPLKDQVLDAYCHMVRITIVFVLIGLTILAVRRIIRFLIKQLMPAIRSSKPAMRLGRKIFKPRIRLPK